MLGILVGLFFMNRIDRRVMLLGVVLTTTFHLLIGLTALLMPGITLKPYAILLFVVGFVFSMQGTIGLLVWWPLAEMSR